VFPTVWWQVVKGQSAQLRDFSEFPGEIIWEKHGKTMENHGKHSTFPSGHHGLKNPQAHGL